MPSDCGGPPAQVGPRRFAGRATVPVDDRREEPLDTQGCPCGPVYACERPPQLRVAQAEVKPGLSDRRSHRFVWPQIGGKLSSSMNTARRSRSIRAQHFAAMRVRTFFVGVPETSQRIG